MVIQRSLFLAPIVLLSCSDPSPVPVTASAPSTPPPVALTAMTPTAAAIQLGTTPLAVDERGVPHLLQSESAVPVRAADAATAARVHVARLAPAWGVRATTMPALETLGQAKVSGGTVVRLRQMVDGMQVDPTSGGEVRVLLRPDGSLIAASGRLISTDTPHPASVKFVDDDASAVARAVSDVYGVAVAPSALAARGTAADGARLIGGQSGSIDVSLARARKAWFPAGATLIAAYIVDAYASNTSSTSGDAFRRVLAADDGRVLSRVNLTADAAFTYRVFAEPTGERHPFDGPLADSLPNATGVPNTTPYPPYVAPNLVTVDGLNHPNGGGLPPDPWLPAGRVDTSGNNVQAYSDVNAPDGLTFGDFRATLTGPATFDRTYDTAQGALASQSQQMAGITSLFYQVNWLHDFWYDAGFTEPTGNAQDSNYGRGGEDHDAINAEAQDNALGGSRNNANMSTPGDGLPPRMQVFLWDGKSDRKLTVSGRTPPVGDAAFGPQTFDVTGDVVLADDGVAPTSDACTALAAPATGKIVLLDRGGCTFKTKVRNAQNAGAIGVILANNAASVSPPGLGEDTSITTPITIGVLSVLQTEGIQIKAELATGTPVTATLHLGPAGPDLDGTLDFTVIAHEFMHYVHHRLSACDTELCGAMSEGWADFDSLLVASRPGDDLTKAYPMGMYSTASFPADPVYFGIRRAPYSVNQKINALSFRHMAEGAPLPTNIPINGGGSNSEVHAAGEVWASMLWEGYVALQKAGGSFLDNRLKMQQYVVTGLLLAPPQATPTEVRDALLIAARAVNRDDHDILAEAYARRGFGSCAVSPPRNSIDFVGIVESTAVKGRIVPGALTSALTRACDGDGVLDAGEATRITVPVSNAGPVALSDVVVTPTTSIAGLHVTPPSITVGTLEAYRDTTVTFDVALDDSVTTVLASDLKFQITSSNGCADVPAPVTVPFNSDDKPASSAIDTFDAVGSVWTTPGSIGAWSHVRETSLDGLWSGDDAPFTSDASLVSPPITAGRGPLSIVFSHRYSFEFTPASGATPATAFDGGVIEFSTDGGATWRDVSLVANPGYTQTLATGGGNPLSGRRAYGGANLSFPDPDEISLFFGTRLAGQTFQLRFRIGSDGGVGGDGWQIDDVEFKGIVGTPFPTLTPSSSRCGGGVDAGPGTDGGAGPSTDAGAGPSTDAGAGPSTDAGTRPDAGHVPDAGMAGDGGTASDAGIGGVGDGTGSGANGGSANGGGDTDHTDSGGCQAGGSGAGGSAGILVFAVTVLLRRRRR